MLNQVVRIEDARYEQPKKQLLLLVLRTYTLQFIMEVRNEHICTLHMDILRGSAITNMEKAEKV
jgi:hypothetical protein